MDTVKLLARLGANVDTIDNNGQTPLYYCMKHGKTEMVEFLVSNGANVNQVDKRG